VANPQINTEFVGRDKISRPMKKIRVEAGLLGKSFKAVSSTASTFGSDFKKIGAGVGLAAAGVVAFGASAVKAAADDQASTASLVAVLKARKLATDANLKSVDAMIAAGQDLAFTDDETRASIATATQFTNKFADAQKINAAAMELARAKNIDLESATTLVGKAYAGNLTAAKKLGIEIPKGTTGIAAAIAIQKKFSGSSKAFAGTFAGSFSVVKDKISELKESIGYALLPAVTKVFNGLKPILSKIIGDITANLPKIQAFADTIATKILAKLPTIVTQVEAAIPKIKNYIQGLVDKFVGMGKSANDILGPGGSIRVALTGLGAALGGIRGAIAANFVASGVDPIQAYFYGTVLQGVVNGLTEGLTGQAVAILIKKFAANLGAATAASNVAGGALGLGSGSAAGGAAVAGAEALTIAGIASTVGLVLAASAVIAGVTALAYNAFGITPTPPNTNPNTPGYANTNGGMSNGESDAGSLDYQNRIHGRGNIGTSYQVKNPTTNVTTTIMLDGSVIANVVDKYLGGAVTTNGRGRLVPGRQ
jgi:hypothetical protein